MNKDALCRAADWLEANPNKHIRTVLARNDRGGDLSNPFDPSATCFCAYGRVLVEVGDEAKAIFERAEDDVFDQLQQLTGLNYGDVYEINDGGDGFPNGKRRVIQYLKAKATC